MNLNRKMMLFCEPCGYKRILYPDTPPDDLTEVNVSKVQTKIPFLDPQTNKTVPAKFEEQPPRFKCPKCGRGLRAKEVLEAYNKVLKDIEERERKAKEEEDRRKRIEDGKPLEKPDFTG